MTVNRKNRCWKFRGWETTTYLLTIVVEKFDNFFKIANFLFCSFFKNYIQSHRLSCSTVKTLTLLTLTLLLMSSCRHSLSVANYIMRKVLLQSCALHRCLVHAPCCWVRSWPLLGSFVSTISVRFPSLLLCPIRCC